MGIGVFGPPDIPICAPCALPSTTALTKPLMSSSLKRPPSRFLRISSGICLAPGIGSGGAPLPPRKPSPGLTGVGGAGVPEAAIALGLRGSETDLPPRSTPSLPTPQSLSQRPPALDPTPPVCVWCSSFSVRRPASTARSHHVTPAHTFPYCVPLRFCSGVQSGSTPRRLRPQGRGYGGRAHLATGHQQGQ